MRLTELNPRWFGTGTEPNVIINGVSFDCPHCRTQRLAVHFKNPIDKAGWIERGVILSHAECEWNREGDTFETLTLTPSIDASRIDFGGHWHGFITKGEVS